MLEAAIAVLSAIGVVLLVFGSLRLRRRSSLSRRLASVMATPVSPSVDTHPQVPLASRWRIELRQALEVIEAHDTQLRMPTMVLGCLSGLLGLATVSPALIIVALLTAAAVYGLGKSDRRRKRIEEQALGAMQLLSQGLRAGYSVPQAIALVARNSPEPTASEFALAAQEISIGVQLADAIARLAKRCANPDYELVAIIVRVQHEVGGNLAQILDSVGNTLRERFDLRRQVSALTAQQRLSSTLLTLLPFGLLTFLFVVDRAFVEPLFTETAGRMMLAIAAAMVFVGWTIMRGIGKVEV